MTEIIDTSPDIDVDPAEYRRLLGYPRDHEITDRGTELIAATREWYRHHGRPWLYIRPADRLELRNEAIGIDGMAFSSRRLSAMLLQAEAHGAFLVAVSAGPEAEEDAHRRWLDEKPDEYFFLETYASAVVEHLITTAGARLCAWADGEGMAILPHYSPGYSQWDIAEQTQLLRLVESRTELPGRLETLGSGALRPKKSQLAVFGLARHAERTQLLAGLVPCRNCPMPNCQFRRVPYRRVPAATDYSVNPKALARWAAERLSLQTLADGAIEARFRYDGTTCTNMGRALAFQYDVILGPPQDGYQIREQHCAPVPGDPGHTAMCQYQVDAGPLMAAIDREKPLLGQPLASVLAWKRDASPAGCYCDAASRQHKWGLVLETIHYALHRHGQER
jgi:hypothetical protein